VRPLLKRTKMLEKIKNFIKIMVDTLIEARSLRKKNHV
jgi:hypothetical protein